MKYLGKMDSSYDLVKRQYVDDRVCKINLTGELQTADYRRSVIALCKVSTTNNTQLDSYSAGDIYFHRHNGLNGICWVNILMENQYSTAYRTNYRAFSNIAKLSKTEPKTGSNIGFRPCTFKYNNVYYGGIELYLGASFVDKVNFIGATNFEVFALDYTVIPHGEASENILNSEVYDSLNFTQFSTTKDDLIGAENIETNISNLNTKVGRINLQESDTDGNVKFTNSEGTDVEVPVHGLGTAAFMNASDIPSTPHTHNPGDIVLGSYARNGGIDLITRGSIGASRSNKAFGFPASAITIEYSRDGGSTWTDYGTSGDYNRELFMETRTSKFYLGKTTDPALNSTNLRLRVTVTNTDRYVTIDAFYIWMSASGNTVKYDVEYSTLGDRTTYHSFLSNVGLNGWPGNNIKYFSGKYAFGGNTQTQPDQIYSFRFIFKQTAVYQEPIYAPAFISDIRFLGPEAYSPPNNMVAFDHMYSWDANMNVTFPKGVSAESFSGEGSSLTSLNASNISSGTLNKDRLANSGATAGTYGPTEDVSGTNNTTIKVPKITVDAKGRVTSIEEKTLTNKNTTYSVATTSANGLMSKEDKSKMDYTNVTYATCSTGATTAQKAITVSGNTNWSLQTGALIVIKFTNTNTANNPTFKVGDNAAKSIYYNGSTLTTTYLAYAGHASRPSLYMYDGTNFIFLGWAIDADNNTYTSAYCTTDAATAAKTASMTGYKLLSKSYIFISVAYSNTAASALTLSINSTTAKPIYINGIASSSTNYSLPAGSYLVYYSGTNFYFRTDGFINAPQGVLADTGSTQTLTNKTIDGYNKIYSGTTTPSASLGANGDLYIKYSN